MLMYFSTLKSGHLTIQDNYKDINTVLLLTCMYFSPQYTFTLLHTGGDTVTVSFDPTTYTVTEGVDGVANLMLVRSGGLTRTVEVTVTTVADTATGMTHHCTTVTTHVHVTVYMYKINPS